MYQKDNSVTSRLVSIYQALSNEVDGLSFSAPVAAVYNPLSYAWRPFENYLRRFAGRRRVVLVGMNPGPWGMVQTGVPFGEVAAVRDWMEIDGEVGKPGDEHPKRPVQGLACERSEVSGRRLWGWARDRFGSPQAFFDRFLVINYCPLLFLEESGRNLTPDRVRVAEREPLLERCDAALDDVLAALEPERIIGIGKFATERCRQVLGDAALEIGTVLHPSPANPAANRGWAEQAERQLQEQGVGL